jgi:hypothetical protein
MQVAKRLIKKGYTLTETVEAILYKSSCCRRSTLA